MCKSPSFSSHRLISNTAYKCLHIVKLTNVYVLLIGNFQSFTSDFFGVVGSLGENLDSFSPLGFDIQRNSDHETPKFGLYSVRALKRCLNEKNLSISNDFKI